ncbi:hypothetical WD-repeat protein alr2800 [Candidatus Moduliflexus flocculans]|uniref:Hypothetical WD-repeat protein alr2800 n=1 Tax=Candidatus Moduliflexus flocculans TaxID=1499966 RepID=A0A081BTG8_9BACT|nr:hypothetical WD-repeat protein alr2800 [Candidatus Moduliflexus flocculans]
MQVGLELQLKQEDWGNASIAAGNLSELYLMLGDVQQAVMYARQSVAFADSSKDDFLLRTMRTALADALSQDSKLAEAKRLFQEAEAIQKKLQPEYPYLYSGNGFRYCDLLLSQGKDREVAERAVKALEIAKRNNLLLDIALGTLSLGRAALLQALAEVTQDFTQAVAGLRKYGQTQYLPLGLLARAALFRQTQEFSRVWTNLEEVFEIAERSEMRLYLTDYHLEACRLCLAEGRPDGTPPRRR